MKIWQSLVFCSFLVKLSSSCWLCVCLRPAVLVVDVLLVLDERWFYRLRQPQRGFLCVFCSLAVVLKRCLDVRVGGQTGLGPRRGTVTTAIICPALLQLPSGSSYISAAGLAFNLLCFPAAGEKTALLFPPCVCLVINEAHTLFLHHGQEREKSTNVCAAAGPLTCPAGWKGFLTHPSHAEVEQKDAGEMEAGVFR